MPAEPETNEERAAKDKLRAHYELYSKRSPERPKGIKTIGGIVHFVKNFDDWKQLRRGYGAQPNGETFCLPRLEFASQRMNYILSLSIFDVLERLGHVSILPAIILFLANLYGCDLQKDTP